MRKIRGPARTPTQYLEDDPTARIHPHLWKSQADWAAALPKKPSREVDVVVVGGGMSGLLSAYRLREHRPLLIEQNPAFGGNSKGEVWGDLAYSTGAAYLALIDKGGEIDQFITELGLQGNLRREEGGEANAGSDKGWIKNFWNGGSDPKNPESFKKAEKLLKEIYDKRFPEVPWRAGEGASEALYQEWDKISFADWWDQQLGSIHPDLQAYFTGYCWSSFGAHPTELSAYQVLNFLASDAQGMNTFPGGNSFVSQRLLDRLRAAVPKENLMPGTLVVSTRLDESRKRVWVTTRSESGKLETISAKACVFAAPKFVAKHVIPDLPAEQLEAISKIRYRAYLVGNVLVKGKHPSPSYEVFWLRQGRVEQPHSIAEMPPFTDVIFAAWASHDRTANSALTLYRALPFDGGRPMALAPTSYESVLADFKKGAEVACRVAGIDPKRIEAVRVSRWGHALPVAGVGQLSGGIAAKASAPHGGRIFFANQDTFVNPCFETAFAASKQVVPLVREALARA